MQSVAAAPLRLTAAEEVVPSVSDVALVQRHLSGVYRFARALGADPEFAADIAQEAFLIAWQRSKQNLPDRALARFLRRTARFVWLQNCRQDRRREAAIAKAAEVAFENCSEDDADHAARITATRRCIERLNGRAQQAVQLRYRDGHSRDQIADALGLAPNGVKTLLSRTRRWLQQCIEGSNHEAR